MKYAILLILAILGLSLLASYVQTNYNGVVDFTFEHGTRRVQFPLFLLALSVSVVILGMALWFLVKLLSLPSSLKQFFHQRRQRQADALLKKGMLLMGSGQYQAAEKVFVNGARVSQKIGENAGVYWSNAANAAQSLGKVDRRDNYLLEARKLQADGKDTVAEFFSEVNLYLENGETQHALSLLAQHSQFSYNAYYLSLKYRAHHDLKDFANAWETLLNMKKYLNKETFVERKRQLAIEIFQDNSYPFELDRRVWLALPKEMRAENDLILHYVSALLANDAPKEAEALLAKVIKTTFSDPLIHAYSQLEFGSNSDKLDTVKAWLKYRPENAYLNYAAAKFAHLTGRLEEAKNYALASAKQLSLAENLALLAQIYEALNDPQNALLAYRQTFALYHDQETAITTPLLVEPSYRQDNTLENTKVLPSPELDEKTIANS